MDTIAVLVVAILAVIGIVIALLFRGQIAVLLNLPGNSRLSVNAKGAEAAPLPGGVQILAKEGYVMRKDDPATSQSAGTQDTAAIRTVLATPSKLTRPTERDIYFVYLTFDYSGKVSDTAMLVVTTTEPDGRVTEKVVGANGFVRAGDGEGHGRYSVSFSTTSKPGTYTFSLQFGGREKDAGRASTSVELLDKGAPQLQITELAPVTGRPGDLITVKGTGFDTTSPQANDVRIGDSVARVQEASADRIVFELPENFAAELLTVLNEQGLAYAPKPFEIPQTNSSIAKLFWMGPIYFSAEEDQMCAQIFTNAFGPDPAAYTATHSGVDQLIQGTSTVVFWCSYTEPTNAHGVVSFQSNNPNVLTVDPTSFLTTAGYHALHPTYTAHNVGVATIYVSGGSTHTVRVIAPPPPPAPPEVPPPQGRFTDASHDGVLYGSFPFHLFAEWTVAPGAGGAEISVTVSNQAIQLMSHPPAAIGEGITLQDLIFLPDDTRSVTVAIVVVATNVNGGASSRIQRMMLIERIPYLVVNGSRSGLQAIDFGDVQRGQSASRQIVLGAEDGNTELNADLEDRARVFGGSAWDIQVTPVPNCTGQHFWIDRHSGCTLTVVFHPTTTFDIRVHQPTIRFVSDARNNPIAVTLNARGVPAPRLAVLNAPGDEVNFGAVGLGDTKYLNVFIENVGDETSVLTGSVRLGSGSDAYTITEGGGDFQLPHLERKTITLAFTPPNAANTFHNNLQIDTSDAQEPQKSIELHGGNIIVRIWSRTFIPYIYVLAPTGDCYEGDNRGFQPSSGTSREEQWIAFDLGNTYILDNDMGAGETYEIYCANPAYYARGGTPIRINSGRADKSCMHQAVNEEGSAWVRAVFTASCPNPLVPGAPTIDLVYRVWVNRYTYDVLVGGAHDRFPAYELYYSINYGEPRTLHNYMPGPNVGLEGLYFMDVIIPDPFIPPTFTRLSTVLRTLSSGIQVRCLLVCWAVVD